MIKIRKFGKHVQERQCYCMQTNSFISLLLTNKICKCNPPTRGHPSQGCPWLTFRKKKEKLLYRLPIKIRWVNTISRGVIDHGRLLVQCIIPNANVVIPNWYDGQCAWLECGRCKIPNDKVLPNLGFKSKLFKLYKCMVGIPHLKSTAGYQKSTVILGKVLLISPIKFRRQSFCPPVFKWKV